MFADPNPSALGPSAHLCVSLQTGLYASEQTVSSVRVFQCTQSIDGFKSIRGCDTYAVAHMDVLRLRAELVRALRQKGVGPRGAKKLIGIDPGTVSRWMNIEKHPKAAVDLNKVVQLLTALNVPLGEFFARVEGAWLDSEGLGDATSRSPSSARAAEELHVGPDTPFSPGTREQLTAWLIDTLLAAAESARRLIDRVDMEEMAAAIADTADRQTAEAVKNRIRSRRNA